MASTRDSADTGCTTVIAAAPEAITAVLLDFESYPRWQSIVRECEVLERDEQGRGSLVRTKVDARIRTVEYAVRYSYALPRELSWQQERGDIRDQRGRYLLTPQPDGRTKVGVELAVDVGFYVPAAILRRVRDQSLRTTLRELRRTVEG